MKKLDLAMRIYEGDNADRFPGTNWCDVLIKNATPSEWYHDLEIAKSLHCPGAPRKLTCAYAMNRNMVGITDTGQIPSDTELLFESDAGWNAVGGPEIAVSRHHGWVNIGLADGSVQMVNFNDLKNQRWSPDTNSAANSSWTLSAKNSRQFASAGHAMTSRESFPFIDPPSSILYPLPPSVKPLQ